MAVSHYMVLENLQVKGIIIKLFKVFLLLKPHKESMRVALRIWSRNAPYSINKVIHLPQKPNTRLHIYKYGDGIKGMYNMVYADPPNEIATTPPIWYCVVYK